MVLPALLAVAVPVGAQTIVTDDGGPFTTIDSTWKKPVRKTSVIRVLNNTVRCGALGDGHDPETYRRKNRADAPTRTYLVTVDAIRDLEDRPLWSKGRTRAKWTAKDREIVHPYEGTPVTVEGYFEIVKKGSKEGTNCAGSIEDDTDWHIALVADPSEREEEAVVIEPTPRFKRAAGWTIPKASSIAVRERASSPRRPSNAVRVRVTGYLMLDPSHPEDIKANCKTACASKKFFRATLWEVHPVTRIQLERGNGWVDLMDY